MSRPDSHARPMMNRLVGRLKSERGQALILFVGIFTFIMVAGAIAVDFGIWMGERRGAQTDADLSSLAGAEEYMFSLAAPAYPADPVGKAQQWFDDNNESGNASLPTPILADDTEKCVTVTVKHDTRALFTEIFGVGPNNIGTHAKACAGGITGFGGAIPVEVDNDGPCFGPNETPIFTQLCGLEYGAQDPNPRGMIDLQASGDYCSDATGSGDIEDTIANGAHGTCLINTSGTCNPDRNGPWYECVAVQTGNPQDVINGFNTRIQREGSCDTDNSGVEEFDETVIKVIDTGDPTTSLYEARICPNGMISPRIVTIIVLDQYPLPGNVGNPIDGLAGFYVAGCYAGSTAPDPSLLDPECSRLGQGNPPGHVVVYGNFVKLTLTGGEVGDPDPSSTLFGIELVE